VNVVAIIGRLGRNPEIRSTGQGKAVTNFAIAVDHGFGEKKVTSWVPIVAWEKTAELAQQYLVKGSQVAVEGRLQQRQWQDKEGNNHSMIEVVASRLDFLTRADKKTSNTNSEFDAAPANEDDPPF